MKIGLKFNMKSYLKFSSKKVVGVKGGWGGGDYPTSKDGSSPWPCLAGLFAPYRLLEPHVRTVQSLKRSPKGRTDLKI